MLKTYATKLEERQIEASRRLFQETKVPQAELLRQAVNRPRGAFGRRDLYSSIFAKAAALGHSLVLNHSFVDGNKRTAWEAMHTFIEENGYSLRAEHEEIAA